ncbi:MAG: phosphatidylserine decarboxylase [Actinomycetota bacterium]|nr:phosphatidylserine decarboxylase [Actinomycetota bacterium]
MYVSNWIISSVLFFVILIFGAYFYLRKVWFYRDPLRTPPGKEGVIVSPADGRVLYIEKITGGEVHSRKLDQWIKLGEITKLGMDEEIKNGWLVGIYMSPLDVHFNYSPIAGMVKKVLYIPARVNLPMVDLWEYINLVFFRRVVDLFAKKFHFFNERNVLVLEGKDISVIVVEIADRFVNKITCFVREGEFLKIGQKLSFIERGSQVDLIILPPRTGKENLDFKVRCGEQVYGGQTILAEY